MPDETNTNAQLLSELTSTRQQITGLERSVVQQQQLLNALRQDYERLRIQHEIDKATLFAQSAEEVAQAAIHDIRQLIPCYLASVILFDWTAYEIRVLAVDSAGESQIQPGTRLPWEPYEIEWELRQGQFHTIKDFNAIPHPSPRIKLLQAEGIRSLTTIPLMVQSNLIGCISLGWDYPGALDPGYNDITRSVATQLAAAIHNLLRSRQLLENHRQLQTLSRLLVEAQENERRFIAREIHDEASQNLTSLIITLRIAEQEVNSPEAVISLLAQMKDLADNILENLHRLAINLHPPSLDKVGLAAALRQYINFFEKNHRLDVQFEAMNLEHERLPPEVETTLYRIVQEALEDIVRHTKAGRAGVLLERRKDQVITFIEDDAAGFASSQTLPEGRLGLLGIRQRAELLGGKFSIECNPESGTTLYVEIPCAAA
ncbi:MAG: GAF domain-containing sensor histidine kinase [Chloroflexi bacterium]|nr:GAF domain-containing sensor histidine kinase [Chloroflexota bacterium]